MTGTRRFNKMINMDNNDLITDNLIKTVNRRAYYMQYGLHLSPKEAIRADFRTAAYKRQFPGRTLLQAIELLLTFPDAFIGTLKPSTKKTPTAKTTIN